MYEKMSISTGLYPNLDLWNANKLHYITLQNPSNRRQDTGKIVEHAHRVIGVEYLKNHSNTRRGTAEKVLCSASKVLFIID